MMAAIFEVPISIPTRYRSLLAIMDFALRDDRRSPFDDRRSTI